MKKDVTDIAVILQKPILTAQEAAMYLGWTISYLYKKTMSKDIPHYKPEGKMLYFDRLELEAWMKRNRIASNDEILSKVQTEIATRGKAMR